MDDNSLMFEGKYLNGERNGFGIEYNRNYGNIFEGDYLNGKKWNGKLYDTDNRDNQTTYELKQGNGYIKEYINDYISYYYE